MEDIKPVILIFIFGAILEVREYICSYNPFNGSASINNLYTPIRTSQHESIQVQSNTKHRIVCISFLVIVPLP